MSSSGTFFSGRTAGTDTRPGAILGLWDGHDAGAAIVAGGRLVAAVNEERLSRRKLEVRFPSASVACCLRIAGLQPDDIETVAVSTSDVAKTMTRWFPSAKEKYYRVRRRLDPPGVLASFTRTAKYVLTQLGPSAPTRWLSRRLIRRELAACGIHASDVRLYDHHYCHAAGAALTCGMDACVVLTVDGLGDGLSATVSTFDRHGLKRIASSPASQSLGVFFELVTTLLNMRELEDEGKVMALADYASPVADDQNPMLRLVWVDGLKVRTAGSPRTLRASLERLHWRSPNEQFAAMAQRTVELAVRDLVRNACGVTGLRQVALSGGVFSNVKANRRVRLLDEVDDVFVFPHMGDGGLAAGAALAVLADRHSPDGAIPRVELGSLALGPEFDEQEMAEALSNRGLPASRPASIAVCVSDLLAREQVVFWFDGRMEFGPRALGHRSVLARADRPALRDRLNLVLKRRVWYQPFCPSVLARDAEQLFADWSGTPDRYMTMTYCVREELRDALAGVTGVDLTCRPQVVADNAGGEFAALLHAMRERVGFGAVLNTSFNIHGEPMVCSPAEAVDVFLRSGADALRLGPFLVQRPA